MAIYIGNKKIKNVYVGSKKIKKIYVGSRLVYSAGNIVTYHVDSGVAYQEEVDEGASCLAPKSFTTTKTGWEFVGWRKDTTASGSILSTLAMGDVPMTLYAVFRKAVTLTTVANGTNSAKQGYIYYNNGAVVNPTFTVSAPEKSGWTFVGWSTAAGSITVSDSTISNLTLSASTIRYAVWSKYVPETQQDIGFTYDGLCKNLSYTPAGSWTATGKVVGRMYSIGNNTSGSVEVVVYIGGTAVRRWYNSPGWPDNMSSGEVKESPGYPGTDGATFTVSGSGTLTGTVSSSSFSFRSIDATGTRWGENDVYISITKVTVTVPSRTDYSVG